MDQLCEVTITVKNQDKKTLKTCHPIYNPIVARDDDPVLKALVDDTVKQFNMDPDDELTISIRINIEVQ